MGLYDEIVVSYPLPDCSYDIVFFQTNSFGRTLGTYYLTKDGVLEHHGEKFDFTGILYFYGPKVYQDSDHHTLGDPKRDMSYSYRAKIKSGNLVWVKTDKQYEQDLREQSIFQNGKYLCLLKSSSHSVWLVKRRTDGTTIAGFDHQKHLVQFNVSECSDGELAELLMISYSEDDEEPYFIFKAD